MENEVREVTYLSLSLMLLAIVIGFACYCARVGTKAAAVRNDEKSSTYRLAEVREYNGYNGKTLYGDDVIELLRLKYDSGINIFVDYRKNKATGQVISSSTDVCPCCQGSGEDHRYFNHDMYIRHNKGTDDQNYFKIATNNVSTNRNDLRNWFPSESKYRAYLVYDSKDPYEYYESMINNYNIEKDNNEDTESGKLKALDSGQYKSTEGSEVTGIVLISYETLGIS